MKSVLSKVPLSSKLALLISMLSAKPHNLFSLPKVKKTANMLNQRDLNNVNGVNLIDIVNMFGFF